MKQKIENICFFYLTTDQKNKLNNNNTYTYALSNSALKILREDYQNYIILIDGRNIHTYRNLINYFQSKSNSITTYIMGGDFDFLVKVYCDLKTFEKLKNDIEGILSNQNVRLKERAKQCYITYKINKEYKRDGIVLNNNRVIDKERLLSKFIEVEMSLNNYASEDVIKFFGGENSLKEFLSELEDNNVLDYYYCYNNDSKKLSVSLFCLYTTTDFYEYALDPELEKCVIDLFQMNVLHSFNEFYNYITYYIRCEFDNIQEYYLWKEKFYEHLVTYNININVLSLFLENKLTQVPQQIGSYPALEERAKQYDDIKYGAEVGKLVYNGLEFENKIIQIPIDSLDHNGLIVGKSKSGKTTTACMMVDKLSKAGLSIHIIEGTGGFKTSFNSIYSTNINEENINQLTLDKFNTPGIFLYNGNIEDIKKRVKIIMNDIMGSNQTDTSRKTNNVILFEEANVFFQDPELVEIFYLTITKAGRKGFSLWFSTQSLMDFPIYNNKRLYEILHNKFVHMVNKSEYDLAVKILKDDSYKFEDLHRIVESLSKGYAMVSFMNNDQLLSAIPIKISL